MNGELARVRDAVRAALDGGAPYAPAGRLSDARLPAGTALVVRTSGSTGTPREVALSATALRASAAATHERLGGPGRWFVALPAIHVAGLQVVSRALLANADVGGGTPGPFTPETFATEATAFLSARLDFTARAAHPAPSSGRGLRAYVSLVPTQAHRLVEAADAGAPAGLETLARFDAVLLGGAAMPAALLARLREAGVRAVTTYGMSETCGGCVYDGVPLPGICLRLADPSGGDRGFHGGDGRPGIVEIAGPVLASGYVGDDDATAAAFRTDDGTRWFRTSDLGRFDAEGRLEILGRADDVIVTGGVNVAPAAVEAALAELGEVCVVGIPDAEWGRAVVAVVVSRDPEPAPRAEGGGGPELRAARAGVAGPEERAGVAGPEERAGVAGPEERAVRPSSSPDAHRSDDAPNLLPAPPDLTEYARKLAATALGRAAAPRHVYLIDRLPLRGPGKPDRAWLAEAMTRTVSRRGPTGDAARGA